MIQDNQTTTIFDPIIPVVSEMAKKYKLEETKEEAIKRLKQSKSPKDVFIVKISKDYLQKKISDDGLVNSLKEKLEISEDTAKELSADIKEKLMPILQKITALMEGEKSAETEKESSIDASQKTEIIINAIKLSKNPPKQTEKMNNGVVPPVKRVRKPTSPEKMEKPDNYRELIQ